MTLLRRSNLAAIAFLIVLSLTARAAIADQPAAVEKESAWTLVSDHWYSLEIAGARSGWMNEAVHSDAESFRTTETMHMAIGRGGGAPVEIDMTSTFIETLDGAPVSCHLVQATSRQPMDLLWVFHDDKVVRTTRQGGTEKTIDLPLPAETWLTPQASKRFWKERAGAGAKEISFLTVDPEQGMDPARITMTFKEAREIEHGGRTMPITVWDSKMTQGPLTISAVEHMSSDAVLIFHEVQAGFSMIFRLATKAEAMRHEPGAVVPDLLAKTFITLDKPIRNVLDASKAVYRLRLSDGGAMPPIPSAASQRVQMSADGLSALVTVDVEASEAAGEADTAEYLESSVLVDAVDPQVVALARSAVRNAGDSARARAEALRAAVYRHISLKGLDTAFASASETAKLQRGDCSEHAVLLCAMLRAQHIPARVATGLLYVDQSVGHDDIFGWHMWTQGLIDGAWVDLDATLPRRYHAGHILTSTSSLGDGAASADLASIINLMGNLKIELVEIEHEGQ